MAVNKIILNGEVLIDLSQDTALNTDVTDGKIFHLATGVRTEGTVDRGTPVYNRKTIERNGTYLSAHEGLNGWDEVIVNVPGSIDLTTESAVVEPSRVIQIITPISSQALSQVVVQPIPSRFVETYGTKTIEENGTYDIKQFMSVKVEMGSTRTQESTLATLLGL